MTNDAERAKEWVEIKNLIHKVNKELDEVL
jgi:hypothetical protein